MKRVICGRRAVTEALRASPAAINLLLFDSAAKSAKEALKEARQRRVEALATSRSELDQLAGELKHQGVIAITGDYPYLDLEALLQRASQRTPDPLLMALDQVQDVHNVGALIRSAVALGASGLILCRHGAAPVSPAAVRVSAGASEHASIARVKNLARTLGELGERGYTVVGLAAEAERSLKETDLGGPLVLVVGSEGRGLRRLVAMSCHSLASIPLTEGTIGSLNVSVAGGVALYEALCQRRKGNDLSSKA